jgi:carboxylesterase
MPAAGDARDGGATTAGGVLGHSGAFDLAGDERGALLVHGFTGTPFEMRFLGERLNERGMTVVGVRLPGHGTTPAELDRTRWTDWYAHLDQELDRLRARCRRVAVIGQSLGGLLALRLAARRRADLVAVASLAAPLWLGRTERAVVASLRRLPVLTAALRPIRKRGGSDVADLVMKIRNPSYRVIPLRALVEFDRGRQAIRAELGAVRLPLLLVHALQDHVAPYGSLGEIAAQVASREIHTLTLPRSYHLVAIDVERERVAAAVAAFLEPHLSA